MVRGMPIIEGFTRMDKEACYRVLTARKDDGSAQVDDTSAPLLSADAQQELPSKVIVEPLSAPVAAAPVAIPVATQSAEAKPVEQPNLVVVAKTESLDTTHEAVAPQPALDKVNNAPVVVPEAIVVAPVQQVSVAVQPPQSHEPTIAAAPVPVEASNQILPQVVGPPQQTVIAPGQPTAQSATAPDQMRAIDSLSGAANQKEASI